MLDYLAMVIYKDSDYTIVIAVVRWFKCNFGAVTPLGDGVMSAFVFLSTAIARALISLFAHSTGLR